jgi:hypothetical protein
LAAFARIIFEDRERWSGQTLGVTSDFASGEKIVKTLTEVAGVPAVYVPCTGEEYASRIPWASQPVAKTDVDGPTHADNWLMWWRIYEDDLILPERDMDRLRKIHPGLRTLKMWMKEHSYDGRSKELLKGHKYSNE